MRRFLSRLIRIGVPLLLLVAGALVVWAWRGRLLEDLVEKGITEELGLRAQVGHLDIVYPRGFTLRDVRLFLPDREEPSLVIDEVLVQVESLPAGPVQSVLLRRPDLRVHEDEAGLDLLEFIRAQPASDLARLLIEDGRLTLTGAGPVHDGLHQALAARTPLELEVPHLDAVPRTDGSGLDVEGSLVAAAGVELVLTADLPTDGPPSGEVRIDPARPLHLGSPELREYLSPAVCRFLDQNHLQGPVAVRVLGEFEGDRPRVQAFIDLLGIELTPAPFPASLHGIRGALHYQDGRLAIEGVDAALEGSLLNLAGALEDVTGEGRLELTIGIRHGRMTDELRAAIALDPHGAEFLDLFQPSGTFNAITRVEYSGGTPKAWLEVEILDGATCYRGELDPETGRRDGFPLPVSGIHGLAVITPDRIHFTNLVGNTATGATVSGTADFHIVGDDLTGEFTLTASNLALDQDFRRACVACSGDRATELFRELGLSGRSDFEFRYTFAADGEEDDWAIEMRPHGVLLRPKRFPFPIRLDAGVAVLTRDRFECRRLRGQHEPPPGENGTTDAFNTQGKFDLAGWAVTGGGPFHFTFHGHDLALGPPLRTACEAVGDERLTEAWKNLRPVGHAEVVLQWRRTPEDPDERIDIEFRPRGVALTLPGIAIPFLDVRGNLAYSRIGERPGTLRTLPGTSLQARLLGGTVHLQGEISDLGPGRLTLRAERLRLRSQVALGEGGERDVVSAGRSASEEAADLLEVLRPNGRIRARCELTRAEGVWDLEEIEVAPDFPASLVRNQPNGVSLLIPSLPARVLWNGGSVLGHPAAGRWTFEELRGNLGDAELTLRDGEFQWGDVQSEIRCSGTLRAVPLHTVLHGLLGAGNRHVLRRWEVSGLTHTELQELAVTIPRGTTTPSQISMDADLDLSRCALKAGAGFEELNGRIEFTVDYQQGRDSETEVRGQLRDASLTFKDLRLHELNSQLRMMDSTLFVDWLEAEFAGGRLPAHRNRWQFPLDGETDYEGTLAFAGVELDRLFGIDHQRTRGWEGVIYTNLVVRGRGLVFSELQADGVLGVQNGQLWEIPVFERLYDLGISRVLGQSELPKFEEGDVEIALRNGVMHLEDLRLQGPSLALFGEGALGPSGLDLHLFPEVSVDIPFVDIPLLGDALERVLSLVERQTLSFRFEGPYQNPRVRWDPVSVRSRSNFAEGLDRPRISEPRSAIPAERF